MHVLKLSVYAATEWLMDVLLVAFLKLLPSLYSLVILCRPFSGWFGFAVLICRRKEMEMGSALGQKSDNKILKSILCGVMLI